MAVDLKDYKVDQIKKEVCHEWLIDKHYAGRLCIITYAFGIMDANNKLEGVITFGYPPNKSYNNGECLFHEARITTLELNRLVINSTMPKNTASYFITRAIKMLPRPMALVSYADSNYNHHGYVYQATNWLYTGESNAKYRYTFEDGSTFDIHRGIDKKGKVVSKEKIKPTLRYIFIHAGKRQRQKLIKDMKWELVPYPKGVNVNYECKDIDAVERQRQLF